MKAIPTVLGAVAIAMACGKTDRAGIDTSGAAGGSSDDATVVHAAETDAGIILEAFDWRRTLDDALTPRVPGSSSASADASTAPTVEECDCGQLRACDPLVCGEGQTCTGEVDCRTRRLSDFGCRTCVGGTWIFVPCGFFIEVKCGLVGVTTNSYPAGVRWTHWYRPAPTGELSLVGYEEHNLCSNGIIDLCSGQVPSASCTVEARCDETCSTSLIDGAFVGTEQPCSLSDLFGDSGVPGSDAGQGASLADASSSTDAM